jgi:hypothetical protein
MVVSPSAQFFHEPGTAPAHRHRGPLRALSLWRWLTPATHDSASRKVLAR